MQRRKRRVARRAALAEEVQAMAERGQLAANVCAACLGRRRVVPHSAVLVSLETAAGFRRLRRAEGGDG